MTTMSRICYLVIDGFNERFDFNLITGERRESRDVAE